MWGILGRKNMGLRGSIKIAISGKKHWKGKR